LKRAYRFCWDPPCALGSNRKDCSCSHAALGVYLGITDGLKAVPFNGVQSLRLLRTPLFYAPGCAVVRFLVSATATETIQIKPRYLVIGMKKFAG
jgi:hypothetical protein